MHTFARAAGDFGAWNFSPPTEDRSLSMRTLGSKRHGSRGLDRQKLEATAILLLGGLALALVAIGISGCERPEVEGADERAQAPSELACTLESDPPPPIAGASSVTMPATPLSGVESRAALSGGGAKPREIGALALSGSADRGAHHEKPPKRRKARLGARHAERSGRERDLLEDAGGYGGLGVGGYGTGGGGAGFGAGHGGAASGGAPGGESTSERTGFDIEKSPFGYAEVQLPYRPGTTPGVFPSREDAKINPTVDVKRDMLSTFAADVDTAAYSIARRAIRDHHLPNPSLVRVEEFVNYFHYDYEPPAEGEGLFSIEADGARSPVSEGAHLLRIGLQAKIVRDEDRKPANLVFLVDTSCSMTPSDRLPLVKRSLEIAVDHLTAKDRVAITTYAGGVSLVLEPTSGDRTAEIKRAIQSLRNGGGTAMASGLQLAYAQAKTMLRKGAITRIIVCSDGDANIGATTPEAMLAELRSYIREGVTLSTIGYGDGNFRDATMEQLADHGNGNYFYVDDDAQAQRVFGRDFTKMIQDVAEDVKIQVELDGAAVKAYRLIGYENRDIRDEDFRNDRVDAGEIGAGHQVTALYALELQRGARGHLATIRVRAKLPGGTAAKETALEVSTGLVDRPFAKAPADLRFAVAVMGAAEMLRGSDANESWTFDRITEIASKAATDESAERREFLRLIEAVRSMKPRLASADHFDSKR
jgi:Ca-activated chloride channel homolog